MTPKHPYAAVGAAEDGSPGPGSQAEKTGSKFRWTSWAEDTWGVEIFCAILGALLVIALFLVLQAYDGKQPPYFGDGIGSALTLNTIVAIIGTGAKAALLLPVAECVSQLKWIWFSKMSRPLSDLSTFDRASRGLTGGFDLLLKTKLSSFAAIGALLMIFGIAIDPFSQQLVAYKTVPFAGSLSPRSVDEASQLNATLPKAWHYAGTSEHSNVRVGSYDDTSYTFWRYNDTVSSSMKSAVQTGLYSTNTTIPDVEPVCPSGNCTFEPYWSLAVCTSFADVSDHLKRRKLPSNSSRYPYFEEYYLTEHHSISALPNVLFNLTSVATRQSLQHNESQFPMELLDFNLSIAFTDVKNAIGDFFVFYAKPIHEGSVTEYNYGALEFVLEWCVQEFTTSVVNSVSTTQRRNAIRDFSGNPRSRHIASPWHGDGTTIDYSSGTEAHRGLQRYLQRTLQGIVRPTDHGNYVLADKDVMQLLFEPFDTLFGITSLANGIKGTGTAGLEHIIRNVATGMTNNIRRAGGQAHNLEPTVLGTIWRERTLVVVRWKWIAAHVIFTVTSILFLAGTIVYQHMSALNGQTWKSSSLAVLHALEPEYKAQLGGAQQHSRLLNIGDASLARLSRTAEQGWLLRPSTNDDVRLASLTSQQGRPTESQTW